MSLDDDSGIISIEEDPDSIQIDPTYRYERSNSNSTVVDIPEEEMSKAKKKINIFKKIVSETYRITKASKKSSVSNIYWELVC
jgi:hypothetical protein